MVSIFSFYLKILVKDRTDWCRQLVNFKKEIYLKQRLWPNNQRREQDNVRDIWTVVSNVLLLYLNEVILFNSTRWSTGIGMGMTDPWLLIPSFCERRYDRKLETKNNWGWGVRLGDGQDTLFKCGHAIQISNQLFGWILQLYHQWRVSSSWNTRFFTLLTPRVHSIFPPLHSRMGKKKLK